MLLAVAADRHDQRRLGCLCLRHRCQGSPPVWKLVVAEAAVGLLLGARGLKLPTRQALRVSFPRTFARGDEPVLFRAPVEANPANFLIVLLAVGALLVGLVMLHVELGDQLYVVLQPLCRCSLSARALVNSLHSGWLTGNRPRSSNPCRAATSPQVSTGSSQEQGTLEATKPKPPTRVCHPEHSTQAAVRNSSGRRSPAAALACVS
mmetsp:Transcript_24263/g.67470  ORF Transcript_24263/g.67470 Transcript_24263/m.67470 type:complete len:206 (+) Transcript_24263:628-1245(+)